MMENDCISRGAVETFLRSRNYCLDTEADIEYVVECLSKEIPAADVRPVVYCRDCIHRPYSSEPGKTSGFAVEAPDRECKCPCFNPDDGYYSWIPADDFFCADGERCEGGTP